MVGLLFLIKCKIFSFFKIVNKSVAFTFVDQDKIKFENKIQVEINGDLFNCLIIKEPLYDPSGQKMRS